jgi:hypothetical protein
MRNFVRYRPHIGHRVAIKLDLWVRALVIGVLEWIGVDCHAAWITRAAARTLASLSRATLGHVSLRRRAHAGCAANGI